MNSSSSLNKTESGENNEDVFWKVVSYIALVECALGIISNSLLLLLTYINPLNNLRKIKLDYHHKFGVSWLANEHIEHLILSSSVWTGTQACKCYAICLCWSISLHRIYQLFFFPHAPFHRKIHSYQIPNWKRNYLDQETNFSSMPSLLGCSNWLCSAHHFTISTLPNCVVWHSGILCSRHDFLPTINNKRY